MRLSPRYLRRRPVTMVIYANVLSASAPYSAALGIARLRLRSLSWYMTCTPLPSPLAPFVAACYFSTDSGVFKEHVAVRGFRIDFCCSWADNIFIIILYILIIDPGEMQGRGKAKGEVFESQWNSTSHFQIFHIARQNWFTSGNCKYTVFTLMKWLCKCVSQCSWGKWCWGKKIPQSDLA